MKDKSVLNWLEELQVHRNIRRGIHKHSSLGLDPAGPRFVDGPVLPAIPELNEEILTENSAAFVDIIHSNGALLPVAVSFEV